MKRLPLAVLLLLGWVVSAGAAELAPALEIQLAEAAADDVLGVWAVFTDKGYADETALTTALDDFVAAMPAPQYERRARLRSAPGLADERDLPVHRPYVEQVLPLVGRYIGTSRIANAVCFEATPEQISSVAELDCVARLQPTARSYLPAVVEQPAPPMPNPDEDYGTSQTQITQIQVDALHNAGYDGSGVTVLMLDTGFNTSHEAFEQLNLIDEYDFVNDDDDVDNEPGDDPDSWYHGTATWSALGAYVSGTLIGPAFGADFLLAKTEDITQEVHDEEYWYQAGIEWGEGLGAEVASSSLGYRYFDPGEDDYEYHELDGQTTIVAQAACWARDNGILLATSVGNDGQYGGSGSLISPADADGILAVGAVDSNGDLAYFSSLGPTADGRTKPEVCAMGYYTFCADAFDNDGYTYASGTSLSAPLVGGTLALLRQFDPDATVADIRQVLLDTATRSDTPDNEYGWGIVQAADAADELALDTGGWRELAAERGDTGVLLRWLYDDAVNGFNVYRLDESPADAGYTAAHLLTTEPAWRVDQLGHDLRPADEGWRRLNEHTLPAGAHAYHDRDAPADGCYYRLEAVLNDGRSRLSDQLHLGPSPRDGGLSLEACYPNPARGAVTFTFRTDGEADLRLAVYDLAGRRVATVFDGHLAAGRYELGWNGADDHGRALPSGVYLYTLCAGAQRESRRLVIVR